MLFRRTRQAGFTLVELLVVLVIMVIITGFSVAGFRNFYQYQRYDYAVAGVETALSEARISARSSVGDEAHGVKFFSDSIVTFFGSTYSGIDPRNVTDTFDGVTISTDLTNGTDEIVFASLSGLPNATGTVQIVGTIHEATTTLTVTATGVIQ